MPSDDQPTTTMTDDEIKSADNIRVCANSSDEVHCHAARARRCARPAPAQPTPAGFSPATLRSFYRYHEQRQHRTTVANRRRDGLPQSAPRCADVPLDVRPAGDLGMLVGTHPCLAS